MILIYIISAFQSEVNQNIWKSRKSGKRKDPGCEDDKSEPEEKVLFYCSKCDSEPKRCAAGDTRDN